MNTKSYKCAKGALFFLDVAVAFGWGIIVAAICIFIPFLSLLWQLLFWPLTVLLIFIDLIYLPLYVKSILLTIGDDTIMYRSGVFINRRRHMKRERIVFVNYVKTPVTYLLQIASLNIFATGSSIAIPYMSKRDVNEILSILSPEIQ